MKTSMASLTASVVGFWSPQVIISSMGYGNKLTVKDLNACITHGTKFSNPVAFTQLIHTSTRVQSTGNSTTTE